AEMRVHILSRKYGAARIRQDLKSRGVPDDIVDDVSTAGELERAREILKRKYRGEATTHEERARRARFLQSRGFYDETIDEAVLQGKESAAAEGRRGLERGRGPQAARGIRRRPRAAGAGGGARAHHGSREGAALEVRAHQRVGRRSSPGASGRRPRFFARLP